MPCIATIQKGSLTAILSRVSRRCDVTHADCAFCNNEVDLVFGMKGLYMPWGKIAF